VGGEWRVYGDGDQAMALREGLYAYDHVQYAGYTDAPKDELAWANLMLHPSDLDGQPNAVLEGLASGLPVVTTDFIAFEEWKGKGAPLRIARGTTSLRMVLNRLRKPSNRQAHADEGIQFAAEHHTPERIGQQYEQFLNRVVSR